MTQFPYLCLAFKKPGIYYSKESDMIMAEKKKQIDEMINEGLGAGQIDDYLDKEKLESPLTKKDREKEDKHKAKKEVKNGNMVNNMEDAKDLAASIKLIKSTDVK